MPQHSHTKNITQQICRGCGNPLKPPFLNLGHTPLANSYVSPENKHKKEEFYPLAVSYCPECHLVQLRDTVPPEELFSEYAYYSSYSDHYLRHAQEMADALVRRFRLGPGSRVLEIASNDGYLLQFFKRHDIS